MKRLFVLLLALTEFSLLASCGGQTAATSQTPDVQPEPTQTSTPIPEKHVPTDIFGSGFNPFFSVQFPDNFNVCAAFYSVGNQKVSDSGPDFVLSMTAEGKTEETITFLAKLAGIEEQSEIDKFISDYGKNAYCEFPISGDGLCTIRKTDPNDDRYAYIEGCYIDLRVRADSAAEASFTELFRDNYNVNALADAAEYFDVTPAFDKFDITVNLHKKTADFGLNYSVAEVGTIQQKMAESVKTSWYDSEKGRMGLFYGALDLSLDFDSKGGNIYVDERTSDLQSALGSYTAPEVSLTTLGFYYSEKDALCTFKDNQNNLSFAVHRPEWGSSAEAWDMLFLDEVNGYLLAVWYYAPERKLQIQADKGSASAKYDYFLDTGKYAGEYPDQDKSKAHFQAVFNTKDDNVFDKAVDLFNQSLKECFGMDMDKLYALPIR